jgi:hypothetical protein
VRGRGAEAGGVRKGTEKRPEGQLRPALETIIRMMDFVQWVLSKRMI